MTNQGNETPEPLAQEQAAEQSIRNLRVGRIEWRCCTDDGAYCMSFDRDTSRDPEQEANEWLERHQRDYPHRFMPYEVRRVVVQSQLQEEALMLLSRLSDATAALQAKDAEIARLEADTGRLDALESVTVNNQWIVAKNSDSFTASFGRRRHATRRTLREAIDAAMKGDAA